MFGCPKCAVLVSLAREQQQVGWGGSFREHAGPDRVVPVCACQAVAAWLQREAGSGPCKKNDQHTQHVRAQHALCMDSMVCLRAAYR